MYQGGGDLCLNNCTFALVKIKSRNCIELFDVAFVLTRYLFPFVKEASRVTGHLTIDSFKRLCEYV